MFRRTCAYALFVHAGINFQSSVQPPLINSPEIIFKFTFLHVQIQQQTRLIIAVDARRCFDYPANVAARRHFLFFAFRFFRYSYHVYHLVAIIQRPTAVIFYTFAIKKAPNYRGNNLFFESLFLNKLFNLCFSHPSPPMRESKTTANTGIQFAVSVDYAPEKMRPPLPPKQI